MLSFNRYDNFIRWRIPMDAAKIMWVMYEHQIRFRLSYEIYGYKKNIQIPNYGTKGYDSFNSNISGYWDQK